MKILLISAAASTRPEPAVWATILLPELPAGQVDRHPERAGMLVEPGPALPAGLVQHPIAQLQDEAGVLGQGDEVAGLDLMVRNLTQSYKNFFLDRQEMVK